MAKKLLFTVTNDLSYDQRMHRICSTLAQAGYEVELIGRKRKASLLLEAKSYRQTRIGCHFEKGKLFYLEYNIRLFLFLLFRRFDAVCAIDLDTIVPCFLVSRLRFKKIVYDAHEYFTEVIEVVNRPFIKRIWQGVESIFVPRCHHAYTVSESIRTIFNEKYGTNFKVIRNVALLEEYKGVIKEEKYMVYIGAVNAGRGLEQLIEAMRFIDSKLFICGDGDILTDMVRMTQELGLEHKIKFFGYVEPEKLKILTRKAYVGFLLLDETSSSYYYSLANKFFDYIHAGIPQITVDFPEYRYINQQYKVAELIPLKIEEIVKAANKLLYDRNYYAEMVCNALKARDEYNWQNESKALLEIYKVI